MTISYRSSRTSLLLLAVGLAFSRDASAQTEDKLPKTPQEQANATKVRAALQSATNQFNAAILRRDVAGTLKWLAPDFRLGQRQYRPHDKEWMKRALPMQFKRGRYTTLTTQITEVEIEGNAVTAEARINAEWEFAPKVAPGTDNFSSGVEGYERLSWVQTPQGWRLRRSDTTLNGLLLLASPPVPLQKQLPANPGSAATSIGLALQEPQVVLERREDNFRQAFAFSPDAKQLVFAYDANTLRFVEPQSGALLRQVSVKVPYSPLTYTSDGNLWMTNNTGRVSQWSANGNTPRQSWVVAPEYSFYRASISPSGKTFATLKGNTVQLWDSTQSQPMAAFTLSGNRTSDIEFSRDGHFIAFPEYWNTEVRNAPEGSPAYEIKDERWGGFLADGKTLVTVKFPYVSFLNEMKKGEQTLFFRSADTGRVEREIPFPLVWSKEQQKLRDQLDTKKSVRVAGYSKQPLPAVAPNGRLVASVYYDGSIGVWDTQSQSIIQLLRGFSRAYSNGDPSLVFSPDSRQLAVDSGEGEIALWNISAPQA